LLIPKYYDDIYINLYISVSKQLEMGIIIIWGQAFSYIRASNQHLWNSDCNRMYCNTNRSLVWYYCSACSCSSWGKYL